MGAVLSRSAPWAALLLGLVPYLSGAGCGEGGAEDFWVNRGEEAPEDLEPCDVEQLAYIDNAIAGAQFVETYVEEALAQQYVGDYPRYSDVLARLIEVRREDHVFCGVMNEDGTDWRTDIGGLARRGERELIVLNFHGSPVQGAFEAWSSSQVYGEYSSDEIEALVPSMDPLEFAEFKALANGYLYHHAWAESVLAHEAAHLVERSCCDHNVIEHDPDPMLSDYVYTVDWFTRSGVYMLRWVPESQWLDRLYLEAH